MNIKKWTAILVSIIFAFGSFALNVSAQELESQFVSIAEYKAKKSSEIAMFAIVNEFEASEEELAELRKRIFNAVHSGEKVNIYDLKIPIYNAEIIADVIANNMPELFGIVQGFSYIYYVDDGVLVDGYIVELFLKCDRTSYEYRVMYDAFEKEVNKMIKDIKSHNLSDVQKALLLHDRLVVKCDYDVEAADELEAFKKANENNPEAVMPWDAAFTAYGIMVEGEAVCQGYTEAYEYLLEKVGIKSERCSSNLLNHIWNIVYINGKSYHVDVTWDDPVIIDKNGNRVIDPAYVAHNNFLLSSLALFYNGHNLNNYRDYNFTPNDKTYDDYFWNKSYREILLIGNSLYHYNSSNELCCYDDGNNSLVRVGIADIDGDKKISSTDVSYCREFLAGNKTPTKEQSKACDVNRDGVLTITDLVRFKQLLLYIV